MFKGGVTLSLEHYKTWRSMMKISKEQQKLLEKHINEAVKDFGWHRKSGTVYKVIGENFVHANYIIINSQKMVFDVWIKKYIYDDLFWTIMDMEENINGSESLRAIAAFKSPSILIEDSSFDLADDIQELAKRFMNTITAAVRGFTEKYDVAEYILDNKKPAGFFYNGEVLKCIVHIDRQEYSYAEEIARKSIENGDHDGGFENRGRGFFDFLLSYIKKGRKKDRFIKSVDTKYHDNKNKRKGIIGRFFTSPKKQNIFSGDRVDFYWESAVDEYCRIYNKKKQDINHRNISENEENIIWEYAGNHIAFFLTWIIKNGFCNDELADEENINLLMDERISGTDFLINSCDGKLLRSYISNTIVDFVDIYYDNRYFDDYCLFIERDIKGVVLGTRFSWEIYHKFEAVIDNAYKEYQQGNRK